MNLKQALQRIEELEARVKALESVKHYDPFRPHFAPPLNIFPLPKTDEQLLEKLRWLAIQQQQSCERPVFLTGMQQVGPSIPTQG